MLFGNFVLLLHGIKQCLYAYFKSNRKELNNRADQENMDTHGSFFFLTDSVMKSFSRLRKP